MDDLKMLLGKALEGAPDPIVDPAGDLAGDLARGRARLRRRRGALVASTAAVVLAVGAVPLALTAGPDGPPSAARLQAGPPSASQPSKVQPDQGTSTLPALELVTYRGAQVPGYRVASTPKGWEIQGGSPSVLTIAPKGAEDRDPNSFVGKLVVMLMSKDGSAPTTGTVQEVEGRPGRLDVQGDTQILTYQAPDERWMVIQAPTSLSWDGRRLADFAAGVEVLDNAEAGVG